MPHRMASAIVMVLLGLLSPATARAEPGGFPDGVAAGEVTPSSAMLWTRAQRAGTVSLNVSRRAGLVQV